MSDTTKKAVPYFDQFLESVGKSARIYVPPASEALAPVSEVAIAPATAEAEPETETEVTATGTTDATETVCDKCTDETALAGADTDSTEAPAANESKLPTYEALVEMTSKCSNAYSFQVSDSGIVVEARLSPALFHSDSSMAVSRYNVDATQWGSGDARSLIENVLHNELIGKLPKDISVKTRGYAVNSFKVRLELA